MKRLSLLLLALPLAACATSQRTAGAGKCDPNWVGHHDCIAYKAAALRSEPTYSPAGFGSGDFNHSN